MPTPKRCYRLFTINRRNPWSGRALPAPSTPTASRRRWAYLRDPWPGLPDPWDHPAPLSNQQMAARQLDHLWPASASTGLPPDLAPVDAGLPLPPPDAYGQPGLPGGAAPSPCREWYRHQCHRWRRRNRRRKPSKPPPSVMEKALEIVVDDEQSRRERQGGDQGHAAARPRRAAGSAGSRRWKPARSIDDP